MTCLLYTSNVEEGYSVVAIRSDYETIDLGNFNVNEQGKGEFSLDMGEDDIDIKGIAVIQDKAVPLIGFKGSKIDNFEAILFPPQYEYEEIEDNNEEDDEEYEYEEVEYVEVGDEENNDTENIEPEEENVYAVSYTHLNYIKDALNAGTTIEEAIDNSPYYWDVPIINSNNKKVVSTCIVDKLENQWQIVEVGSNLDGNNVDLSKDHKKISKLMRKMNIKDIKYFAHIRFSQLGLSLIHISFNNSRFF